MQFDIPSKEKISIEFPKGGDFQFEVWSPQTVKEELAQGNWEFDHKLSKTWGLELHRHTIGQILQITPGV